MTKPAIINFIGAPGAGKTTLAEHISKETGFYFFQREVLMNSIFGNERDTEPYKKLADHITNSMCQLAIYNAKLGISSITEGTLKPVIQGQRAGFLDAMLEAGKQHDFNVIIIYCTAPADIVLAHLKQRGAIRDEPKYDPTNKQTGWPWFLKTFIDVPGPTQYEHLWIDTTLLISINVQKIIEYLKR